MHIYTISSGSIALVAATALTGVQLVTGATRKSKILEIGVSFGSVTNTDQGVLIELREQSTAGTSSAFTPLAIDPGDPAAIQTARNQFTVEPTDVALVYPEWKVTPIGGTFVYRFPLGYEFVCPISKRYGVRLTSPQAQASGTWRAYLVYQE